LTFSASHEYPNANPSQTYTATATVTDNAGAQAAGSTQMVVTHVFSDITNLSVTNSSEWEDETAYGGNIYPATPATITGTLVNFDPSQNVGVMIDWGDSSSNYTSDGSDNTVVAVNPVANGDGTFSFTATHTYGVGGTYTVTVTASQGDDVATQTATAIVNYVRPVVVSEESGVGMSDTHSPQQSHLLRRRGGCEHPRAHGSRLVQRRLHMARRPDNDGRYREFHAEHSHLQHDLRRVLLGGKGLCRRQSPWLDSYRQSDCRRRGRTGQQ
jgi:hypothetical protein